jgi:hypothetical protein
MAQADRDPQQRSSKFIFVCTAALVVIAIGGEVMAQRYSLALAAVPKQAARVAMTPVLARLYLDDLRVVRSTTQKYWVGIFDVAGKSPVSTWREVLRDSGVEVTESDEAQFYSKRIPFVYQRSDAKYLQAFRSKFRLDEVISGVPDEYEGMLALGRWVGTRWDHGTDSVPGGDHVCDPAAVVESGTHGAKYLCEIAARTMVQASTSLAWPARVITLSRNGYVWEHAVAELWSNKYDKWFVVDTDFNVVYERKGIPLSAIELSRYGEQWQSQRELTVRRLAPAKASLPSVDLVSFYEYVQLDLRNDWCTRILPHGSPAGGDRNTWWTARPSLPRLLTAKLRVDDSQTFDWEMNRVGIYAQGAAHSNGQALVVRAVFGVYSPVFRAFQVKLDKQPWAQTPDQYELLITPGEHILRVRIQTASGFTGPESRIAFRSGRAGAPVPTLEHEQGISAGIPRSVLAREIVSK